MNGYQSESEDNSPKPPRVCCLIEEKERCKRLAGNACYSKRIQKTVSQKKLKLAAADRAGHIYICNYHKDMIQSARSKRKRKDSEDDNDGQEVDVSVLQTSTLRRYKRHFKLQTRPGLNKTQLVELNNAMKSRNGYSLLHEVINNQLRTMDLSQVALQNCYDHSRNLSWTISRHFKTIPAPEKETISLFIYMAKTRKSKLDQKADNS